MPYTVERIALPASSPGTFRSLAVHRFGRAGARPKAYLQAAIHADEPPGMLILHHLARRLAAADAEGQVTGEVILVPVANPIGLDQMVQGAVLGRHDFRSAGNYNRGWPDLATGIEARILDRLGSDPVANAALVRATLRDMLDAPAPADGVAALQVALARLACDADLAVDLHCDEDAEAYVMTPGPPFFPLERAVALAADTGVAWLMPSSRLDGSSFDLSLMRPWARLQEAAGPDRPVPLGCYAVTFEMRGMAALDDGQAARDAAGFFRHLQRLGAVAGDPGSVEPAGISIVPVAQELSTPCTGLVLYPGPLGRKVARGDLVAEILDPAAAPDVPRAALHAGMAGHVISRRLQRIVAPGDFVAMIVGPE